MPNFPLPIDLDKSGNAFQGMRIYLGPSLGWVQTRVKPEFFVTAGGTYQLGSDAGIIFVNVPAAVTLVLPDVTKWVPEFAYQPSTAFERAIWVKDLGGNASVFPITVNPFPGQFIDLLTGFQIINNRQLLRLYPLADLSGWFVG